MSDFGETLSPVARKQYTCEWCGWRIPIGEQHKQYKGVFDGEWQNWRMHNECFEEQQAEALQGEPEFMPGCGEPPQRIKELAVRRP